MGGKEQKLRRVPILALRLGERKVAVSGEAAVGIGLGEFHAANLSLLVVEGGRNERFPEQAVVNLLVGLFVIGVHAALQAGKELVTNPGVEIIRGLRPDGAVERHGGCVRRAVEYRHA